MRIDVKPVPKARPRVNKTTGRIYTPNTTRAFEKAVREAYGARAKWEGDIDVYLKFDKENFDVSILPFMDELSPRPLRGDLDNYAKAVLDALNGVAYDDDKQIRRLVVEL